MASFCLAESLVLVSFLVTESVDAPTAIKVFLPGLPREGYLKAQTTTGVAEGLGISKDVLTADGEASPAQAAMAARTTAAAEDLCFLDDLVTADEVEATATALTEVATTPSATAAA
jgi:hypothetical protein